MLSGTQTMPQMNSVGCQWDLADIDIITEPEIMSDMEQDEYSEESDGAPEDDPKDPNYIPSDHEDKDQDEYDEPPSTSTQTTPLHLEDKFIVFDSCLKQLFKFCHCPNCGSQDITTTLNNKNLGTMIIVTIHCSSCLKQTPWHSQPYIGDTPAGNIFLSASILFSGATPTKVLRVLDHMSVASITPRTYFRQQKFILQPVVLRTWKQHQQCILGTLHAENRKLILGGDGRADSPGHCAKYGAYTMMELEANLIVDLQLVQVFHFWNMFWLLTCSTQSVVNLSSYNLMNQL